MRIENFEGKKIFSLDLYLTLILDKNNKKYGLVEGKKDYAVDIGNNQYRIMPLDSGEFSSIYYRGQNSFYSPCQPSIYRSNTSDLSLIRRYEFERILKKICLENLVNHYLLINNTYKFSIEYEGLCQHYELPTSLLDISKNKDIAKFFAMCEFKEGKYFPRDSGKGYLYTIDLTKLEEKDHCKVCLIGSQPLPRPKEQSGIAIKLGKHEDFNKQGFVSLETIEFKKEEATEIFDKFNGGDIIFPKDPIKKIIDEVLLTVSNETIFKFSKIYNRDFYNQFKKILDENLYVSNDYYANLLNIRKYKKLFIEIENYVKLNMLDFGVRGWCEHFEE